MAQVVLAQSDQGEQDVEADHGRLLGVVQEDVQNRVDELRVEVDPAVLDDLLQHAQQLLAHVALLLRVALVHLPHYVRENRDD